MTHRFVILAAYLFIVIIVVIPLPSLSVNADVAPGWYQIKTNQAPPPRYDHMLVDTGEFKRLVLFGGRTADNETLGDTWIYELTTDSWRQVKSAISPMARLGAAVAYDAARKRIIMFGGFANPQIRNVNDTWIFNLETESWSKIETTGTAPVARYGVSGVIDSASDLFIVSHGFANTRYDDTLALDLQTNKWTDISPATRPLKRCLHEAIFDTSNKKMLLFGGCSSGFGPCPQGDLWSYNLAARAWTELKPQGPTPPPSSNPSFVFDPGGVAWLFGGRLENGYSDELWSFDPGSNAWTRHQVSSGPSARASHDAIWDAVNRRIIVFGGQSDMGVLNDLWAYKP